MALSMVKQDRRVLRTDAVESHGAMDVRVVAANDMACGDVDEVFAFVGEDAFDGAVADLNGRPASEEDGELGVQSVDVEYFEPRAKD